MKAPEDHASANSSPAAGVPATGCGKPVVSVVIPCFNAARTLADALASVAAQTFANIEVFVVDDGSRDLSRDVAMDWATSDARFHLVALAGNQGPSTARRIGVERSSGACIAFLDADDMWSPDHIARHVAEFSSDPRLGVSFSPCTYMDALRQPTGEASRIVTEALTPADLLCSNPTTTCSALVVRREVIDEVGYFRAGMDFAEDQEWLFRVAMSDWTIRGIAERTVQYRRSPSGLSANTAKMEAGWHRFIEHAREIAPELVARTLPKAKSAMNFYWARQSLTSGDAAKVRRHFLRGLCCSPSAALDAPAQSMLLAGACLSPSLAATVSNIARNVRRV